jgi:RNA polymerase sigma-70 factor (ECF subfamily)
MPDTEGSSLLDPMADLAEEAGEETRHGLPEAVRAHLGTLLGRTYDRIGLEAGAFTPGTNLEAWLFTILRNVFYSQHRKQGREVADTDGNYAERLTSIPEQGGHLDLQDVRAALDRLAPVMREALVLVAIENLSYEEAAVVMNCRIGTVKSRVWRAREQLARMLGYNGTEIGSDGVMLSVTGTSA